MPLSKNETTGFDADSVEELVDSFLATAAYELVVSFDAVEAIPLPVDEALGFERRASFDPDATLATDALCSLDSTDAVVVVAKSGSLDGGAVVGLETLGGSFDIDAPAIAVLSDGGRTDGLFDKRGQGRSSSRKPLVSPPGPDRLPDRSNETSTFLCNSCRQARSAISFACDSACRPYLRASFLAFATIVTAISCASSSFLRTSRCAFSSNVRRLLDGLMKNLLGVFAPRLQSFPGASFRARLRAPPFARLSAAPPSRASL